MPRALWLADALRAEGVRVVEHPGWRERGSATFSPRGVICHHTAGPAHGDAPSLGTCVNGRPGLPGPLCQIVLARSGTAIVIASGRANHAGLGGWRGLEGNTSVLGIEAENTGLGEPWPDAQYHAYVRIVAALCRRGQIPVSMVCGHKEWAPKRKIDPRGIDMAAFRAQVTTRLNATAAQPPTTSEEFTMDAEARAAFKALNDKIDATRGDVWVTADTVERRYGSLRGWVAAIGAKLGVTRAQAAAGDTYANKAKG